MKTITIQATTPYAIHLGDGILSASLLQSLGLPLHKRLVMITDSHLYPTLGRTLQKTFQAQGLNVDLMAFPAGEMHKTRETKQVLEDELLTKQYGRDTCFFALGGGVVSDLVGFLAATYCRGVPVVYLPTTLLAMVDASIGGKTGVNTRFGKNLIGSFTQPQAVIMDMQLLHTLPKHEWQNGMVEMIKHAIIADADLYDLLHASATSLHTLAPEILIEMIYQSCLIKQTVVEQDEHEQGLRQILNFGHTIGHAIETFEHYKLSHGEAVAIGMVVEAYLAMQMGYIDESLVLNLENVLRTYGLALKTRAFEAVDAFKSLLLLDKKTVQAQARFVLLQQVGQIYSEQNVYSFSVSPTLLQQALDWAAARFGVN